MPLRRFESIVSTGAAAAAKKALKEGPQRDTNFSQVTDSLKNGNIVNRLEMKNLVVELEKKAELLVEKMKQLNSKDAEEEMELIIGQLISCARFITRLDLFGNFFFVALDHLTKKRRAKNVLQIYRLVTMKGLVDLGMLGAMHAALTQCGLGKEADEVFTKYFSSSLPPITVKKSQALTGYSRIITGMLSTNNIDDAWKVYKSFRTRTLVPNHFILHSFLVYYIKAQDPINGLKCYNQLVKDGAIANPRVYSVLLELLVDNPIENDLFWREYCDRFHNGNLASSQGEVDSVRKSIFRHRFVSLIKRRSYEEAHVIFKAIPIHSKSVYISMALAFKHNEEGSMAIQAFNLMESAGYSHCAKTRGILMNVWRNEHRYGQFQKQVSYYLREFGARKEKVLAKSVEGEDGLFRDFLKSEVPTWKTMLLGYLDFKKWKRAARLFAEIGKMGYFKRGLKMIRSRANGMYRQQPRRRLRRAKFVDLLDDP